VDFSQNILVTGATGLLGAHLLVRLAANQKAEGIGHRAESKEEKVKGNRIIGLRRAGSDMEEVKRVFSFYGDNWEELYDTIEWRYGDMLDPESLEKALKGIDQIYHCAAIVSFDPSQRENLIKANVKGTKNLITLLLKPSPESRVPSPRLLHVSSTSALGDSPGDNPSFLINEKTPRNPNRNHSGYSVSKHESEKIVFEAIDQGLNAWIVNPGIILGPGFWDKGSSKLFSTVKKGLKFYTKGGTGYVDVRDLVEVLVALGDVSPPTPLGQGGRNTSPYRRFCLVGANLYFEDFFNMVADELGVKRPTIKAGKFLSGLAWRIGTLKARITGTYPLITNEPLNP